jgi:hypothetical protein
MTASEILMVVFTAVIAVTGVIGAIIFGGQMKVMQGQLDEMKTTSKIAEDTLTATQRPWVSVKAAIGPRGLFFNENGANLHLIFALKNTGHTPAMTVRIEGGPRIGVKTNDRMTELEKVCSDARKRPPNPKMVGYTIFPDEPLTLDFTYTFASKEDLDRMAASQQGFIIPVVLGCVDYLFAFGDPIHHQSRFVYDVDYPIPGGGSRAVAVADGDKSVEVLLLRPWIEAGSFQAD